jgi:hypothetical protein
MVAYNTRGGILGVANEEIAWWFKCATIDNLFFGDYDE